MYYFKHTNVEIIESAYLPANQKNYHRIPSFVFSIDLGRIQGCTQLNKISDIVFALKN